MEKMKNKKLVFYKILLIILVIIAIFVTAMIAKKYIDRQQTENENKKIVQEFKNMVIETSVNEDSDGDMDLPIIEFEGHKVIGIIKISKIDLEYPILDETTKATMKKSISRYWGGDINSLGNVSLAGHNNYDGTMFGKNKKLKIGDTIELTDLLHNTVEYEIYEIFSTDPNDVTILQTTDSKIREVTLITCTNGRAERLIIKAREK